MSLVGTPTAGTLAQIRRAFERLNPSGDLDVDILAISHAAACSSSADWTAQALTNVRVDPVTGAVTLAELTTAATIFSQTTGSSQSHPFTDGTYNTSTQVYATGNGPEEYALDFFPDAGAFNGVPFTLDSVDVFLGLGAFVGTANSFRFTVGAYDARWRFVPLGDPIDVTTTTILKQNAACVSGGVFSLKLRADYNRRITFEPGTLPTHTGPGRDSGGLTRIVLQDASGASTLVLARGLSIAITPNGPGFQNAWIGCCPAGTLAGFDPGTFWRYAPNRQMGPYDPTILGYAANDVLHNPDDYLTTGAVPRYGAIANASGLGTWGIARRVRTAQRPQDPTTGWHQPYHVVRAVSYQPTGSVVATLDLGATPVNPVQVRLNDVQPAGTSIAYTLAGSADQSTWTAIGTVTDGQQLTGATLFRYYQLTASLTAGGGTVKYATPALLAWQMVERVTLSTWRYLEDFDADASVDPVTGQSSVAELKLPMLRAGVRGYRDLATQINSQYAPSSIEAHVYARDTISGARLFVNSYRLENRAPEDGAEVMTFTGGLDLLSALVPPAVESYRYPAASGQEATITSVAGIATTNPNPATGNLISIDVSGTPFHGQALAGFFFVGVSGACAKQTYLITADQPRNGIGGTTSTDNSFVVNIQLTGTSQNGPVPAVGDTFEIHSYLTARGPLTYSGQDFAAIAADLLTVQSGVASRYRGQLPATTSRLSGTYTLPAKGVKALDILAAIALHCGGAWQWINGRIQYFDVYGPKDSVLTLDERHYVQLETPLGADRRMPSIKAKYGYDASTQQFANELQTDDADALTGWGRANLFDVFELPDELSVWNDALGTEATYLTTMLQHAWKTGVRLWTVDTVLQYPWLNFGDAITVITDQYTDRRLAYASDGVTDIGSPVSGRIAAVGVIVGKNLWGDKLVIAVRGLDAITGVASNTSGSVAGASPTNPANPSPPIASIVAADYSDETEQDLTFSATAGVNGGSSSFDYTITAHTGASHVVLQSGSSTSSPLPQTITISRHPRFAKVVELAVTDHVTGLIADVARYTLEAQRQYLNSSGQLNRGQSFSDGGYAVHASDAAGNAIASVVGDSGSRPVNTFFAKQLAGNPDTLDSVPDGGSYARPLATRISSGKPWIDFSESIHANKTVDNIADGATYGRIALTDRTNVVNTIDSSGVVSGKILPGRTLSDGTYPIRSTTTNSNGLNSAIVDSGGRAANRFLAKNLSGDPDSVDALASIPGASYRVPTLNEATGGGRGYTGLDSSGFAQVGVRDGATIAGRRAGTVGRTQFSSIFTESFDSDPSATWSIVSGATGGTWSINGNPNSTRGSNVLTATKYTLLELLDSIPFDASKLYRLRVRFLQNGNAPTYIGILQHDYQGNPTNTNNGAGYLLAAGDNYNGSGWTTLTTWVRGASLPSSTTILGSGGTPTSPIALNANTVSIQPYLLLNYNDTSGAQTLVDFYEITEYDEDGQSRTYSTIDPGNNLYQTVGAKNGVVRNITSGRVTQNGLAHGGSLSFPSGNFQNPPLVKLSGGVHYRTDSVWGASDPAFGTSAPTTSPQITELEALNVTASGGSVRARLRQAGSPTNQSNAFPSTTLTAVGATAVVTSAQAPANNDTYSASFSYDFLVNGSSGGRNASHISVTVSLDYYNGSSWVTVATGTYAASDPGVNSGGTGTSEASGSDVLTATVTGRTTSSQFRLTIQSDAVTGLTPSLSLTPGTLTYTTSSGDQYASMTPSGVSILAETIGAS